MAKKPITPDIQHRINQEFFRNQKMKKQLQERQVQQSAKNASAQGFQKKLINSKLGGLMPGNIGDINKVVWPFWFTFSAPELAAGGTSSNASFTVSQEAAFIWMSFSAAVFLRSGAGPNYVYTHIDTSDESAAGNINNLNIVFRDAQSSRVFQRNPMPIEAFGSPQYPTVLRSPVMFLPNATVEVQYTNNDTTNVYVPFITFFGYRVRIQNAENILSLVTG